MQKKRSERSFPGVGLSFFLVLSLLLLGCRQETVAPTQVVAAASVTPSSTATTPALASATVTAPPMASLTATASATVAATATAVPPTATETRILPATATALALAATPTAVESCEIVADTAVTVYQRPSAEAGVFGTLDQAVRPEAQARTLDEAWIGFEPAVAQAANIGVFRMRWVEAESVRLEGACAGLEVVEGPPAGVCFTMPMLETMVYATPAADAEVVTTLNPGDYAAVSGRYGQEWARLDLDRGNVEAEGSAWVEASSLNLNGPCELPEVTP